MTTIHLDLHRADRLTTLFNSTANFTQEGNRRWGGFGEDVNVICSHSFLSDQDFFGPVDDKVATLVSERLFTKDISHEILYGSAGGDDACECHELGQMGTRSAHIDRDRQACPEYRILNVA